MIKIYYSPPNQLEISGSVNSFQMVRWMLQNLATDQGYKMVEISANTVSNPSPYDQALSKLVIRVGQGLTRITVQNDCCLQIEGAPDNLDRLASFFDFVHDAPDEQHQHYEYYEGNEHIAPESIPVVVHLTPRERKCARPLRLKK
jgi:hypothetical protein